MKRKKVVITSTDAKRRTLEVASVSKPDPNEAYIVKRFGITVNVKYPDWWTADEHSLNDNVHELLRYVRRYQDLWYTRTPNNLNSRLLADARSYLTGIIRAISRRQRVARREDFSGMIRSEELSKRYPAFSESIFACMHLPTGVVKIVDTQTKATIDILSDRRHVKELLERMRAGIVRQYQCIPPRV